MGWGLLKFLWLLLNRIWIYGGGRDRKREQRGVLFPWALIQNAWISVGNKQKKECTVFIQRMDSWKNFFFLLWLLELLRDILKTHVCCEMECPKSSLPHNKVSYLMNENINKWGWRKLKNWGRLVSFCSESEGVGLQRGLEGHEKQRKEERDREMCWRFSFFLSFWSLSFSCFSLFMCLSHTSYFYILI